MIAAQKLYFFDKISYVDTKSVSTLGLVAMAKPKRRLHFLLLERRNGNVGLRFAQPGSKLHAALGTNTMANKQSGLSSLPRSRAEAQNLGLDRFFTGVPCIHGHVAARYVSTTNCLPCQVEHARRNGAWKARPSKGEFILAARELVEGKGGELLSTEYVSAKSKLEVRCKRKHVFKISPDSLRAEKGVQSAGGLSERHKANRWTIEEMREFARRVHRGDCLAEEPALSTDKVEWVCKHGHKFVAAVCKVMPARRLSASVRLTKEHGALGAISSG
jgi:hypothetical protein